MTGQEQELPVVRKGETTAICPVCKQPYVPTAASLRSRKFICKPCKAIATKARYERRKAEGLPVSGRRMPREYHRAYELQYSERPGVREARRERAKQRFRNPVERMKAEVRRMTRDAIAAGKLVREPCEVCGEAKVDAHHDDYGRPFDVRWLCRIHHAEHHHTKARASGGEK
jgi:hypothetical protein